MVTLKLTTEILASKETVWEQLWSDSGYRNWTSAFCEGSYAESDWNEGSRINFLSPDGSGMFALIEKNIPLKQMTFKHLGEVKDGKEIPKDWAGGRESYFLDESSNITSLTVELDVTEEFESYFNDTFPKALQILKEACEKPKV